jgi:hypothetical protein
LSGQLENNYKDGKCAKQREIITKYIQEDGRIEGCELV